MEFPLFLFLENELVVSCNDTSTLSAFRQGLEDLNGYKRKTLNDQKEYELSKHLLFQKISNTKPVDKETAKTRDLLLGYLNDSKSINFDVNESLIVSQTDGSKRNLINGYDDGAVSQSWLILFAYNPLLFKTALVNNSKEKTWRKTGLFLCNTFRENSIPLSIRYQLKENTIAYLQKYRIKDNEMESLIKEISDCDISVNLND
jgi:hypothetical protein